MRTRLLLIALGSVAALIVFGYLLRQLSMVSVGLAANRDSQHLLRRSLEDQKRLARLDPQNRAEYRKRFDETRTLLTRLEILELSRQNLTRQFELVLVGLVAAIVAIGTFAYLVDARNRAQMHSRAITRERQRVQALEHLSSWQQAARRHAHEMRTPLTAAHMEVSRLIRELTPLLPERGAQLHDAETSILEELEQLRRFTSNFVAFAAVGSPALKKHDLSRLVSEFCETFAPNWPALTLRCDATMQPLCAMADREMLRQVFVNLCNNSALALGDGHGTVHFTLGRANGMAMIDVADDGPGIPDEVRKRLFEPYTTTRRIGEGMGLGLAISKKILLDHGGDLELAPGERGTTFRLTLPAMECDHTDG